MRVALVTSHPVPFALGGAENLWWGLQDAINTETEHSCDIVSLITPEASFWELVDSYQAFAELDLSHYDCVITGKYPAWMINHPNHVCYMLHRLRGLYDTYGGPLQDDPSMQTPRIAEVVRWMATNSTGQGPNHSDVSELFAKLRHLRQFGGSEAAIAFPGPFSRAVVHFLDQAALSANRINKFAAISQTVAKRADYFPPGTMPEVLYPPPHRKDYHTGEGRYFFTSSRLDGPKRIGLLIEAMRYVSADIELRIAGNGPDKNALVAKAASDHRIKFLGFVPDEDIAGHYADALAVPFVPYDEDYGLVTIEAMRSGKPVVTVTDSGGPCEFVEDGVTGFVTEANPKALGERLQWLAVHPKESRTMGLTAQERVARISWLPVVGRLLSDAASDQRRTRRPKLTVATTFRCYPPRNGGQARVFYLYRSIAETFDIDLVCLGGAAERRSEQEVAPGLLQIVVPRSQAQSEIEHELTRMAKGVPVDDISAYALAGLTPDFEEAVGLSALTSQAVVACHPYLVDVIARAAPDKPLWYEAQDVESVVKAAALSAAPTPVAEALLAEVASAERRCWLQSERVFACAQRDLDELSRLYGGTRARQHEVPNGVAIDEIVYTDPETRRSLKGEGRPLALFMGSWHGPNLEAVEEILSAARQANDIDFAIIGSVCEPFRDHRTPDNLVLMGQVDDEVRNALLSVSTVALNPMRTGSGTNLKMLDYFAAGVPVLSTRFGARGLDVMPGTHYAEIDDHGLAACLSHLIEQPSDKKNRMVEAAHVLVESQYSWSMIASNFVAELQSDKKPHERPS